MQYEIRTYFRYLTVEKLTGSTAQTFLEYIQRNVPEGVAIKVNKVIFALKYFIFNIYLVFLIENVGTFTKTFDIIALINGNIAM